MSEQYIVWYVLNTVRISDGVHTTVHRRFKDFAELNSSVKQNLKGLYSSFICISVQMF